MQKQALPSTPRIIIIRPSVEDEISQYFSNGIEGGDWNHGATLEPLEGWD